MEAIEGFKKKDKIQDEYIGRINNGLVELKPKVQQMGEVIHFISFIHSKKIDVTRA